MHAPVRRLPRARPPLAPVAAPTAAVARRSVARAFAGLLGVLTAFSGLADEFLAPLRSIVKATPVTSFIILVLLYLTSSLTPAFIAFLVVTPIVWANVRAGVRSARAEGMPTLGAFAEAAHVRDQFFPGYKADSLAAGVRGR